MDYKERRHLRGNEISIIFQEPGSSLNPVFTVGDQVMEVLKLHQGMSNAEARTETIRMFNEVGIPRAEKTVDNYPHELSGGMKQRVMIAMAIACGPDLLIADEPTTALDVTIQAQILRLLNRIQEERQMAVLLITHDLGVVNEVADRVLVMNKGKVVETAERETLFKNPQDAYTKQLLNAVPKPSVQQRSIADENLIEIKDLKTWFPVKAGVLQKTIDHVKAVDGVSLNIKKGETLALVGESGSGKTTVGKTIAKLIPHHSGSILYDGVNILDLNKAQFADYRRKIQVIFQDPANSLNPRMLIRDVIGEGLRSFNMVKSNEELEERIMKLLNRVGMPKDVLYRYPHEFSGGQRQRICIARALAVDPEFVICDEATSALDVSVQAEVLELLKDLQTDFGLTYLFITHNLSVVQHLADRVAVMRDGKLVERGETKALFEDPQQQYTKDLLSSAPSMDPDKRSLVY